MSQHCPHRALLSELRKAVACQQARCEAVRSNNARLSARLSLGQEGAWQVKYEREVKRHQEMIRRLEELEAWRKDSYDILFEDFWKEEATEAPRKDNVGRCSQKTGLMSTRK